MRPYPAILAALLLTTACTNYQPESPADPAHILQLQSPNLTGEDAQDLRYLIQENWNKPFTAEWCHAQMHLHVTVAPDGTVQRIDPAEKFHPGKACEAMQASARDAIEAASPLVLPDGKAAPTFTMTFDSDRIWLI